LSEANIVHDEQVGTSPGFEAQGVGVVGETGVQIGEEVDTASVTERDAVDASAHSESFEDVALAGTTLSRNDEVVVTLDEVEPGELEDECLVERGLEVPVEGFECLVLDETAGADPSCDTGLGLVVDLCGEDVLEPSGVTGTLAACPSE
jgi:hypothetical protein